MKTHQKLHLISHLSLAALAFLGGTVWVLWAWNTFMPEVLGLVAIQYKHALALVVLGFGLSFIFGHPTHRRRYLPGRHHTAEQEVRGAIR